MSKLDSSNYHSAPPARCPIVRMPGWRQRHRSTCDNTIHVTTSFSEMTSTAGEGEEVRTGQGGFINRIHSISNMSITSPRLASSRAPRQWPRRLKIIFVGM